MITFLICFYFKLINIHKNPNKNMAKSKESQIKYCKKKTIGYHEINFTL